jgi:23S rRNA pseudouridine1911/1915/1917 synthase
MAERPDIPFDILFEDDAIVVVDKPAGMIVHPAPGHEEGAMPEFLVKLFPEMRAVGSV